jgi:hypothetical protein
MGSTSHEWAKYGQRTASYQVGYRHVQATRTDAPSEQDKKDIIRMKERDGLTFNEIARRTGFSSSACNHVHRRWRNGKGVSTGRVW